MRRERKMERIRIGLWGSVLMAGLLLAGMPAVAQEADQVFVYQHSNFGGAYMRFDRDQEIPDLRNYNTGAPGRANWNDQISSVKVGANKKIVLYEHIKFGGAPITLNGSSCNSKGSYPNMPSVWNDRASSFKIMANDQPQPGPAPTAGQVAVYEHMNYCGAYMMFRITEQPDLRSYNTGALGTPNWNDRISSIRVGNDVKLIAYEHTHYGGASMTLTGPSNIPNLSSSGWNDKISSLKVVPK